MPAMTPVECSLLIRAAHRFNPKVKGVQERCGAPGNAAYLFNIYGRDGIRNACRLSICC